MKIVKPLYRCRWHNGKVRKELVYLYQTNGLNFNKVSKEFANTWFEKPIFQIMYVCTFYLLLLIRTVYKALTSAAAKTIYNGISIGVLTVLIIYAISRILNIELTW